MKEEKQTALEAAFTQALFKNMEQADSFGITDKRLRANCEKYGAVSAVKEYCAKKEKAILFSAGGAAQVKPDSGSGCHR